MLFLIRFCFTLVAAPPLLLALLLFLAVESEPSTQIEWQLTDEDIEKAKQIFEGNTIQDNVKTIELAHFTERPRLGLYHFALAA